MKAMIINNFGNTDAFELADVPKPQIQAGHVVVKIAASSVNTVDTMIRQMGPELPLSPPAPAILGMDFAGTIAEVASDVADYRVGDEVYGCAGGLADLPGALAEYMLADINLIALKPRNISMQEAAALPLVGITAYEGLTRAGAKNGQRILVHGGSGGVGHVALQIARHLGASVYATGGGQPQLDMIERLGATPINYKTQSVESYVTEHTDNEGFDVVFDSVGGANMSHSFNAAKLNGHVASTVAMVDLDLTTAHFKGLSLHVVFMLIPMLHNTGRAEHSRILNALSRLVEKGAVVPVLDKTQYNFTEIGKAHARLESGQARGKVVVTM